MKIKLFFSLFALCLAVFFTACEQESLTISEEQTFTEENTPQFRSNNDDNGDGFGCTESLDKLDCNCKYRIDYVSKTHNVTWSLKTTGGRSRQCCVNRKYVNNVDITEGCGEFTDIPIGEWRSFTCGLNPKNYFRFSSADCSNQECVYSPNTMQLTVSCQDYSGGPASQKTFSLFANGNGPCAQEAGVAFFALNGNDCQIY